MIEQWVRFTEEGTTPIGPVEVNMHDDWNDRVVEMITAIRGAETSSERPRALLLDLPVDGREYLMASCGEGGLVVIVCTSPRAALSYLRSLEVFFAVERHLITHHGKPEEPHHFETIVLLAASCGIGTEADGVPDGYGVGSVCETADDVIETLHTIADWLEARVPEPGELAH